MRSLRSQLLVGIMGSLSLLVILFGVTIYIAIHRALVDELDRSLASTVRTLAASTEIEDDDLEIEIDLESTPDDGASKVYYQFWQGDGEVLMRSDSLGGADLPRLGGVGGALVTRNVTLPGGVAGRAMGMRFVPLSDDEFYDEEDDQTPAVLRDVTVVAARDTAGISAQLGRLAWILIVAGATTIAAALGVCLFIVGRGLAPVGAMAEQIGAIDHQDLNARIEVARLPTEITPVVDKLNALLGQLEAAFERERSFTGDAAHELRTPLAGFRSIIEVAQRTDRPAEQYKQALADCLAVADRMQAMIESLLLLARLDAGQLAVTRESVALGELVARCFEPLADVAAARGLAFDNKLADDATCMTDRDKLIMMITNVLENAVEYADDGGRITVTGRQLGDLYELTVANTGCALAGAQLKHVCERFWRADESRTATGVHAGLGLALVDRLAASLGGTVTCAIDDEGVFAARITLRA